MKEINKTRLRYKLHNIIVNGLDIEDDAPAFKADSFKEILTLLKKQKKNSYANGHLTGLNDGYGDAQKHFNRKLKSRTPKDKKRPPKNSRQRRA